MVDRLARLYDRGGSHTDIRIGVTYRAREIDLELPADTDRDALKERITSALSGNDCAAAAALHLRESYRPAGQALRARRKSPSSAFLMASTDEKLFAESSSAGRIATAVALDAVRTRCDTANDIRPTAPAAGGNDPWAAIPERRSHLLTQPTVRRRLCGSPYEQKAFHTCAHTAAVSVSASVRVRVEAELDPGGSTK